eukprot:scaffold87256_cov70-Phaeocystis_antarctica.AAC.4
MLSSGVTPTPPPTSTTAVRGLARALVALWPKNPSIFTLSVPPADSFAAASRLDVHEDGPPKALTWKTTMCPSRGAEVIEKGCHCKDEIDGTLRNTYWPAA